MFSSFAGFVQFSILLALALIFVVAGVAFAKAVLWRAFSDSNVVIGVFAANPKVTTDQGPYLLTRTQQLKEPVSLDSLYEIKVPPLATRLGAKQDLALPDDLKITLKGVDLPGTINNLFSSLLPNTQPVLTAQAEPAENGSAVRVELKEPSGKSKVWRLTTTLNGDAATLQIVDQAIYRVTHYQYHDLEGPRLPWSGVNFPTATALEAFYAGQQHLGAYQRVLATYEPNRIENAAAQLKAAEQCFRTLFREMPDFVDGLMLLGVTLSERNDHEALIEAIDVFERVRDLLSARSQRKGQTVDPADQKALYQTRLFHASLLRQLYTLQENHSAVIELEELKAQIKPLLDSSDIGPDDKSDYRKIYISLLTEEAYALAANLILLPNERKPPGEHLTPDFVKAVTQGSNVDPLPANASFHDAMEWIYRAHHEVARDATAWIDKIDVTKGDGKRVQERFRSDLYNVEGYARYRRAQALVIDDTTFEEQCKDARAILRKAYAGHQNQYTIPLNLGLVYADRRCDPKNEYIQIARGYFQKSTEIKPSDYYGHQQLAALGIREAYSLGLELADSSLIENTVTSAQKAQRSRPNSGTILVLLAQAYILQWPTANADSRKTLGLKIEALLNDAATSVHLSAPSPFHLSTARLQWLLQQCREASDGKFADAKKALSDELQKAKDLTRDDPTWYGKELASNAKKLGDQVSNLKSEAERSTLHWPD